LPVLRPDDSGIGLLVSLALLIGLVCGWGGGVLLALADRAADQGKGRPSLSQRGFWRWRATFRTGIRRAARGAGRALSALIEVLTQALPTIQAADSLALFYVLYPAYIPPGLSPQTATFDSFIDDTRGYATQQRVRQTYVDRAGAWRRR